MNWLLCLILSILLFLICIVISLKFKMDHPSRALYVKAVGVFLAIYLGLFPMFGEKLAGDPCIWFKTFFADLIQTMQVFTLNFGAEWSLTWIGNRTESYAGFYSTYMLILFL